MARIAQKKKSARAPWERANPKSKPGQAHQTLTAAEKADAKRHAEAAGRPYPNLVDNMREARLHKKKAG